MPSFIHICLWHLQIVVVAGQNLLLLLKKWNKSNFLRCYWWTVTVTVSATHIKQNNLIRMEDKIKGAQSTLTCTTLNICTICLCHFTDVTPFQLCCKIKGYLFSKVSTNSFFTQKRSLEPIVPQSICTLVMSVCTEAPVSVSDKCYSWLFQWMLKKGSVKYFRSFFWVPFAIMD